MVVGLLGFGWGVIFRVDLIIWVLCFEGLRWFCIGWFNLVIVVVCLVGCWGVLLDFGFGGLGFVSWYLAFRFFCVAVVVWRYFVPGGCGVFAGLLT